MLWVPLLPLDIVWSKGVLFTFNCRKRFVLVSACIVVCTVVTRTEFCNGLDVSTPGAMASTVFSVAAVHRARGI